MDFNGTPVNMFIERIGEIFNSNQSIYSKVAIVDAKRRRAIYYNRSGTRGTKYPQINYSFLKGRAEEVLPATRGTLSVFVYVNKEEDEPYLKMTEMIEAIEHKINKRPQNITNIENNKGLLCKHCLRTSGDDGYLEDNEVFYMSSVFDIVISDEFDNYTKDYSEEISV